MGVLECSRKDCENIMCDYYVDRIGYICYECVSEFKEYLVKEGLNPRTEGEITIELRNFITTPKNHYTLNNREISVDDFFQEHTR